MKEEYEYVKVTGSIFDLKDDFEGGNLYCHYYNYEGGDRFIKCTKENDLFIGWKNEILYKRIKKERKFNEGEWYPCIDKDGENGIYFHSKGKFFIDEFNLSSEFDVSSMKWVGESLGKIEFGGCQ